jgi:fido (protein-threonine AMPylation protein)
MHPPDCPSWDYEKDPRRAILKTRAFEVIQSLRDGSTDLVSVAVDSRGVHRRLFLELAPPGCEYFAGHYRGERYRCLLYYRVTIPSDPRVGVSPAAVAFSLGELNSEIRAAFVALDSNSLFTSAEKLRYIVALASRAFVAFLTIHPYANGNGHAARLIIWSILGRYGYWPERWTVEPRPPDPPYSELIVRHRNGQAEPLETYILQMLA